MFEYGDIDIHWDGHASLRFEDDGFTVAVDPFSRVCEDFEADIVLVTHEHEGHFDRRMIERICGDGTCLVVPESLEDEDLPCKDVESLDEGDEIDVYGVEIEAVPMYSEHHDRGDGLGYVIVMAENSFYVAGDSGFMDEVSDLENRIDVAFLPVEGVYTMGIDEAVRVAAKIKPDTVVPYHYGHPFFSDINTEGLDAALERRSIGCQVIEPEE